MLAFRDVDHKRQEIAPTDWDQVFIIAALCFFLPNSVVAAFSHAADFDSAMADVCRWTHAGMLTIQKLTERTESERGALLR